MDFWCSGAERILVDPGEEYRKLQLQLDKLQRVAWIESLGPWEIMATGTFRWTASCESARRCFERWMRKKFSRLSYFYVVEQHPGGHGSHVHSLWADCRDLFRKEAWFDWCQRYGWSQVELVRSARDSSDYASKYLCKENGWWNVHLQWHRLHKLHGHAFKLESGAVADQRDGSMLEVKKLTSTDAGSEWKPRTLSQLWASQKEGL